MTAKQPSPLAASETAATLRAWLGAVQCPPAVQQCIERECARLDAIARPASALGNGPHEASTAYALLANERAAFDADLCKLDTWRSYAAEALGEVRKSDSAPRDLTWDQILESIREQREELLGALDDMRRDREAAERLTAELADTQATRDAALDRIEAVKNDAHKRWWAEAMRGDKLQADLAERDRVIAAHVAELAQLRDAHDVLLGHIGRMNTAIDDARLMARGRSPWFTSPVAALVDKDWQRILDARNPLRHTRPAGEQPATDAGERAPVRRVQDIARALIECTTSWERDALLLGNISAVELTKLALFALAADPPPDDAPASAPAPEAVCGTCGCSPCAAPMCCAAVDSACQKANKPAGETGAKS